MPKYADHEDGAAGKSFIPDAHNVRAGLPKSKDQAEGDIPQGSSGTATPGQSAKQKKAGPRSGLGGGSANGERTNVTQGSSKTSTPGQSMQVTAEDVDFSDEIGTLFEGDDFSDDFKDKATLVFETAVVAKINEQLAVLQEAMEEEFEDAKVELAEAVNEKLDQYLNYVIENWMEENQLAVEVGIKSEMTESFLEGLKSLFTEHYVHIPEEDSDILESLAERVEELEEALNAELDRNVELSSMVEEFALDEIFEEVADGLTESQVDKLKQLSEAISYETIDEFQEKLETIKESYFKTAPTYSNRYETSQFDEEEIVDLNEDAQTQASPAINKYVSTISRTTAKK